MGSSWLVGVILALACLVLLYTPGPGRRVRHWAIRTVWWKVFQSGRAIVNVRVVDGAQEGLSGRRVTGTALATPGRIEFTMWVGGFPLFRRPVPAIEVTTVGPASPPRGLAKVRFGDPDVRVVQLRTPTATLEIALGLGVPAEDVLTRLRVPDMPPI